MTTPTISTAGATNALLKITDHEGNIYRIPFVSGVMFTDTSNSDVYRIDVAHARGEISLKFAGAAEVTTALASIDALYRDNYGYYSRNNHIIQG